MKNDKVISFKQVTQYTRKSISPAVDFRRAELMVYVIKYGNNHLKIFWYTFKASLS